MSANLAFLTLRPLRKALRPLREISLTQRTQRENRKERRGFSLCTLRDLCILCGFVFFFSTVSYSQSDKFGGIGVSVDIDSSVMQPYIVDILSGKPGAMAGLRSGDHIISINHWNTKGKSQEQVANKLRGRIGSQVDLDIDRGGKNLDFVMKREQIVVNEKAENFCEILNTVIKATADSFREIQGNKIRVLDKWTTEYFTKAQFPNFDSSKILRSPNDAPIYTTYFFIGRDSIQVMNQWKKLISTIKNCLPYSIVKSFNDQELTGQGKRFWYEFCISSVNDNKYNECRNWWINIIRECESDNTYSVQIWIEHPHRID